MLKYYIILILLFIAIMLFPTPLIRMEPMSHTHIGHINSLRPADRLYEHLKYFSYLFESIKLKYWIIDSTLLGAVRDKNIIVNDVDIDFGVNIEDAAIVKGLREIIRRDGYQFEILNVRYAADINSWDKLSPSSLPTLRIYFLGKHVGDIYFYLRCPDGFMRRYDKKSSVYFWPPATYPAWFTDELITVKVRNLELPAPRDPEILLEHWFGSDWKIFNETQMRDNEVADNRDFYGRYLTVKLNFLTDYLLNKYNIRVKPHFDYDVKYVYPPDHLQWVRINDSWSHAHP
jgi:hypothetical protein